DGDGFEEYEEEEYDEDEDDEDDDDDDDEEDSDMEIVVPNPYQGAPDNMEGTDEENEGEGEDDEDDEGEEAAGGEEDDDMWTDDEAPQSAGGAGQAQGEAPEVRLDVQNEPGEGDEEDEDEGEDEEEEEDEEGFFAEEDEDGSEDMEDDFTSDGHDLEIDGQLEEVYEGAFRGGGPLELLESLVAPSGRPRRPRRLSYGFHGGAGGLADGPWRDGPWRDGLGLFGDSPDFGDLFSSRSAVDAATTHPLLVEGDGGHHVDSRHRILNINDISHLRGPFMQPLLGGPGGARAGIISMEFEDDNIPVAGIRADDGAGGIAPMLRNGNLDVARGRAQQPAPPPPEHEELRLLHGTEPGTFSFRWFFEARVLYGVQFRDRAARLVNAVINAVAPVAIAERRRRLEQERLEAEKERAARDEEEKAAAAAKAADTAEPEPEQAPVVVADEPSSAAPATATPVPSTADSSAAPVPSSGSDAASPVPAPAVPESEDVEMAEASAVEEAPADVPAAGQPVAATETPDAGSGDQSSSTEAPTAEAAPAPAPARIIVQIGGNPVDITDTGIDPEFLEALPDDLRMEVFNQHMQEQRQQQRQAVETTSAPLPEMPDNPDLTEFLDALPPDIRDEVIFQQRSTAARPLPPQTGRMPSLSDDTTAFLALMDSAVRQVARMGPGASITISHGPQRSGAQSARADQPGPSRNATKRPAHREVVQLVDRQSLASLLRLLFVPEPANKSLIHRLLLNLAENGKTRLELVALLLTILSDGSGDVVAVDRSFSQLSIKGKTKSPAATPVKKTAASATSPSASASFLALDTIPNLVPQRCLETLHFLVSNNERLVAFLLSEIDGFAQSLGRPGRATPKKAKGKEKATSAAALQSPVTVLLGLLEKHVFLSNQSLLEQLVHLLATVLRPMSTLFAAANPDPKSAPADSRPAGGGAAAAESDAAPKTPGEAGGPSSSAVAEADTAVPKKQKPKPPSIPDHLVKAVVRILTAGECSSKTFQYTLSMIQHLSSVPNIRAIIVSELTESAQSLGNAIADDLVEVAKEAGIAGADVDLNSGPLTRFSSSSSQQAKLLRVLKTVDFLFSKTAAESVSKEAGLGPQSKQTVAGHVIAVLDSLAATYNHLDFARLWQNLGTVLSVITNSPDLAHIGTILLPSIEAFMVISKPYVIRRPGAPKLQHSASTGGTAGAGKTKDMASMSHEERFIMFTEENRKILNSMVRNNPSLMSGSFSLLVQNPKMLEFDNKRTFFNQQLHKKLGREQYGVLHLNVRRAFVFEDSYHQLHGKSGDEIKNSRLNVRFHDEEGVDVGGVTREWFSVLARQMFNPDYALFKPSAVDKVTYQPNRASGVNPDHLMYFRFVGRIIGKAIYDGRLLDCYFTRSFYKTMLEIAVDWKDMEAIDPEFHKSLEWMLTNDITDVIDLTFSTEVDDFGIKRIIDLKPDGSKIEVTEENKTEYVALMAEQRLVRAIRQQMDAFLSGFHDIIPKNLIKIFNERELELLISGLPDVDVDDWKNNTDYVNYSPTSPQIQWFWRAIRSFSQEEKAKLVQFATGTSKVPLEGFKALDGS
ncbi:hypothetical protein HK405_006391, partial [Cladochytrium tenue]